MKGTVFKALLRFGVGGLALTLAVFVWPTRYRYDRMPFEQAVHIEPHAVGRLYLELGRFGQGASMAFGTAWGARQE